VTRAAASSSAIASSGRSDSAVGIALRGQLALYLQTGDGDAAARVGSLANARRTSLAAIGLERHAREVGDLSTYLAKVSPPARAAAPAADTSEEQDEPHSAGLRPIARPAAILRPGGDS
jgi:hypothetical protein